MKKFGSISLRGFAALAILFSAVICSAQSENRCLDIFARAEVDPLQPLLDLEAAITAETAAVLENKMPTPALRAQIITEMMPKIEKINEDFEQILLIFDGSPAHVKKVAALDEAIREVAEARTLQIIREKNTDFAQLILNPQLIKPDRFYEVNGLDPYVERVMFTKDVAQELMWGPTPMTEIASHHILRAIFRGKVGYHENGISSFMSGTDVHRVRISGEAGAIRAAGFFVGRDYYVVTWSNDKVHDNDHSAHLIQAVRRARTLMGL